MTSNKYAEQDLAMLSKIFLKELYLLWDLL
jgi:hypothetical protein